LRTGQLTAGFSWNGYDEKRYAREDVESMVRMTTNFIQESCKDLLVVVEEIYTGHDWRVEFLHRTVSDFLYEDRVRLVIKHETF
jgi:hypothetical protein